MALSGVLLTHPCQSALSRRALRGSPRTRGSARRDGETTVLPDGFQLGAPHCRPPAGRDGCRQGVAASHGQGHAQVRLGSAVIERPPTGGPGNRLRAAGRVPYLVEVQQGPYKGSWRAGLWRSARGSCDSMHGVAGLRNARWRTPLALEPQAPQLGPAMLAGASPET